MKLKLTIWLWRQKCVELISIPQCVFLALWLIKHRENCSWKRKSAEEQITVEILFLKRCGQMWAMASSFLRFLDHTKRRTTVGRTPWTSDQLVIKTLPHITQQTQQTNIRVSGGIRTRNPSNRKAADPHLRPHRHPDWLLKFYQSFQAQVNSVLINLRVCCWL
jgi:hypothetical protein